MVERIVTGLRTREVGSVSAEFDQEKVTHPIAVVDVGAMKEKHSDEQRRSIPRDHDKR
jgi:hypothetical protein